ncbi:MAG: hypothetical protein JNM93_10455 [Bacteriovoracaceae bacterium]|nr:hypothetical protein [Bacteriovoracaceae bacterium]
MTIIRSTIILIASILLMNSGFSAEYIIYSVSQQLPMGDSSQKIRKNYYVSIGSKQGVNPGDQLDVFRVISKYNPYDESKRINYKVKIGTLKVIHSEDDSAITAADSLKIGENDPVYDVETFMIGDYIAVSVD